MKKVSDLYYNKAHLKNRFGMTNQDAYYAFQTRIEILKTLDGVIKVIVKWEHEWP